MKHTKFGSRHDGRDGGRRAATAKVTVDFDDETVGRKRLVVAFAGLERGFD